jgi:hypothetical protein
MRALLTRAESWISLTQPTRPRSRKPRPRSVAIQNGQARLADAARVWLCLRPPRSPPSRCVGPHVVVGCGAAKRDARESAMLRACLNSSGCCSGPSSPR